MDNSHDSNEPVAWIHVTEDGSIRMWSKSSPESIEAAIGVKPVPLYTSPPASKPLMEQMVVAAARMLSDRQAAACNVDCGDMWKIQGNDFLDDARAALEAAHGI